MASNPKEMVAGGMNGSVKLHLISEGLTNQESKAVLARLRAKNTFCRRVPDQRLGRWVPSIGREFYCVYAKKPRTEL